MTPSLASAFCGPTENTNSEGCTVLVVDDEPDIRCLLRIVLEEAGYWVVEAAHGEAALDQVRLSPPQLVLTDWMMPRMDGGQLIERLRAESSTRAVPIVIISSTDVKLNDANAVLAKPFDPAQLIALADDLTGKAR